MTVRSPEEIRAFLMKNGPMQTAELVDFVTDGDTRYQGNERGEHTTYRHMRRCEKKGFVKGRRAQRGMKMEWSVE